MMKLTIFNSQVPEKSFATFVVPPGAMIGRGQENRIVLSDPAAQISLIQAIIKIHSPSNITVTNLGHLSLMVNGKSLGFSKEIKLKHEDQIHIGHYYLLCDLHAEPVSADDEPAPIERRAAISAATLKIPPTVMPLVHPHQAETAVQSPPTVMPMPGHVYSLKENPELLPPTSADSLTDVLELDKDNPWNEPIFESEAPEPMVKSLVPSEEVNPTLNPIVDTLPGLDPLSDISSSASELSISAMIEEASHSLTSNALSPADTDHETPALTEDTMTSSAPDLSLKTATVPTLIEPLPQATETPSNMALMLTEIEEKPLSVESPLEDLGISNALQSSNTVQSPSTKQDVDTELPFPETIAIESAQSPDSEVLPIPTEALPQNTEPSLFDLITESIVEEHKQEAPRVDALVTDTALSIANQQLELPSEPIVTPVAEPVPEVVIPEPVADPFADIFNDFLSGPGVVPVGAEINLHQTHPFQMESAITRNAANPVDLMEAKSIEHGSINGEVLSVFCNDGTEKDKKTILEDNSPTTVIDLENVLSNQKEDDILEILRNLSYDDLVKK